MLLDFFFFSTDTDLTANGCYTLLMTSPHITKLTSFFYLSPVDHMKRVYCCAFGTSSMKIRLIECQPVRESASVSLVTHLPTENPTRTVPFLMLLQWPSMCL